MKKITDKILALSLAGLMAGMTACSSTNESAQTTAAETTVAETTAAEETTAEEATETTESETEAPASEETDATPETASESSDATHADNAIPSPYRALIDDYCNAVQSGEDRTDGAMFENCDIYTNNDKNDIDIYVCLENGEEDPLKDYGFQLVDLDKDGRSELIVGKLTPDATYFQCCAYTIDDNGDVVRLFYSWFRSLKVVLDDGTIVETANMSSDVQISNHYKVELSEMKFINALATVMDEENSKSYYFADDSADTLVTAELTPGSEYEISFDDITEKFPMTVLMDTHYTSFADYLG